MSPLPLYVVNAPGTGPSLQRLGRYHLSDCLGGGPTGEVFRAKVYGVAGMDREFAVKRFHTSLVADPQAAAALASAARMYGALEHPRIARLHEFGDAGAHTFTATEYVPGLDLAQLNDQGSLSLGTAARLVVQIGRAVGYAHGRGLSHLGLAPTNVICSDRGQIKVTDFGVLPPRLSSNPAGDDSLRQRLCYLAPEQIKGLRTSPATDVYQLGTLAYELMVGRRPYRSSSNADLAKQMLGMSVPETGLPRPYEKLLQRALARSPFERFPDAGAMADALEAALRSSPTPGSAADAGEAVSTRLHVLREQRDGQASGILSFPVPAPPKAPRAEVLAQVAATPSAQTIPPIPSGRPPSAAETVPYLEDLETETPIGDFRDEAPTLAGGSSDQVPTLVRPDVGDDELSVDANMELGPAGTDPSVAPQDLLGGVASAYTPPDEAPTRIQAEPRQETQDDAETVVRDDIVTQEDEYSLVLGDSGPRQRRLESTLGELEPSGVYDAPPSAEEPQSVINRQAAPGIPSVPAMPPIPAIPPVPAIASTPEIPVPGPAGSDFSSIPVPYAHSPNENSELIVVDSGGPQSVPVPPPPTVDSGIGSRAHRMPAELLPPGQSHPAKPDSGKSMLLPAILGGAALAVGAFFGYQYLTADSAPSEQTAKVVAHDGGLVIPAAHPPTTAMASDAATMPSDAATAVAATVADAAAMVAATTQDAASALAAPPDAATALAVIEPDEPDDPEPGASERLRIHTVPAGAKVYLDGTMVGTTPVDLDASTDQHRLALLLPGHDLYTSDIQGTGQLNIELAEVTPPGGPAGIKVRCKNKNRYYVFVDGDPVGQLCPSERIGVSKGPHVVEIYDPLTDSRKAFNVNVVDTRLSVRLKVD